VGFEPGQEIERLFVARRSDSGAVGDVARAAQEELLGAAVLLGGGGQAGGGFAAPSFGGVQPFAYDRLMGFGRGQLLFGQSQGPPGLLFLRQQPVETVEPGGDAGRLAGFVAVRLGRQLGQDQPQLEPAAAGLGDLLFGVFALGDRPRHRQLGPAQLRGRGGDRVLRRAFGREPFLFVALGAAQHPFVLGRLAPRPRVLERAAERAGLAFGQERPVLGEMRLARRQPQQRLLLLARLTRLA
jgi:hypothetical protein